MAVPNAILVRAADRSPVLRMQFSPGSDEIPQTIKVEHLLGAPPSPEGHNYLDSLAEYPALAQFLDFYRRHNGLQFCRTFDSRHDEVRPLLELKPAEAIASFTSRYSPHGDLAWIMDLNKSRSLYRGSARWLAFAEIDSGPMCLTIFLDGDHAGSVYFATPQPWFNILRPIAKDFHALLNRIADDVAAFLRLVRATVTLHGADGDNYGLVAIEYRTDGGVGPKRLGRTKRCT
jgi:hypothetical protein